MKKPKLYLIAYYIGQPNDPSQTRFAGYLKDNNSYQEQLAIAGKVKDRDLSMAGVILDMMDRRVVKCSWKPGASFNELWDYYRTNYKDHLKQVIDLVDPPPAPSPEPAVVPAPETVQNPV